MSRICREALSGSPRQVRALTALSSAAVLVLAGCASGDSDQTPAAEGSVSVVASTTILGSIADQVVACGGGEVTTLMPVGADPHGYSPSSADVATMVDAELVITNGLGLEEGLESTLATAQEDGAVIFEVAPELDPQSFSDSSDSLDPHVWLDVSKMSTAAAIVGDELAQASEDETYSECGAEVSADLNSTDSEVRTILDGVPPESRVLITDHAAFDYFARAYDYEIAGAVVPNGSTLGRPSSSELADLAQTIQDSGVKAIFSNTATPTALIDALAQESGEQISVVGLYVGSLGEPDSGAGTYQGMMLTNAQRIADALSN